jgi:cytochrome P450
MRCGPYRIPKGTVVATPLFAIQNTKHNWDQPDVFMPERWLHVPTECWVYNSRDASLLAATNGQKASNPAAAAAGSGLGASSTASSAAAAAANSSKRGITFMPFSEGPRNCVGQSLAKVEVLTLLAKLLANFTITLAPEMGGREGVRARESTHLTLQTAGTKGIRCHMHPRVAQRSS